MTSSKIQPLNALNFDTQVLRAAGPVLVEFTATWCGPCKVQAAILAQVAERSPELVVGAVDVDDCPELAAEFGVRGMPTLIAFQDGKETARRLGVTNEQGIRTLLGQRKMPIPSVDHAP
jgi:thioredoxin 1